MKLETEVKILEIDVLEWTKKLEEMGAKKVGSWIQKRNVYDFHPAQKGKWIRLRTNGVETTLAIKEILDKQKKDGMKELETIVSDFDQCAEILVELGYTPRSTQENRRIQYLYQGIEIDIDTWPMIPTYIEIEGNSVEEVENFLQKISYHPEKMTTLDVESVYKDIYGIDLNAYPKLTLTEEEKCAL